MNVSLSIQSICLNIVVKRKITDSHNLFTNQQKIKNNKPFQIYVTFSIKINSFQSHNYHKMYKKFMRIIICSKKMVQVKIGIYQCYIFLLLDHMLF